MSTMEIEIPDPDEFNGRNDRDDQNRRMQFSLLRGYSLQEQPDFLYPALSCRRRSIERILCPLPKPVAISTSREDVITTIEDEQLEPVEDLEPEMPQTRRATISAGTTALNPYKKRVYSLRDWPLGEPKLRNDDDFFELELNTGKFKPEEISARVVGKELIVHCQPNSDRRRAKEPFPREIFRCYQLPLSSPPLASDVSIVKDDHWLKVAVRKESALKSPIGIYTPEMIDVLEEEQILEEDQEMDNDVRMDD